ncbi:hypothetical protein CC80DRAFT_556170 [Byssothecium circinans]|uniref:Uncharacterized protein n=1 Tax=Byssothecium circinans TaxID=147558 RepID=A0A6A5TA77_9PLEO|nr:hypothetical protein CC80DRAFT_556301 [Byssothecium circinans]KAF1948602.1 hypothetical protein CC80DRAFT_556170 [Byssothecium circinans]
MAQSAFGPPDPSSAPFFCSSACTTGSLVPVELSNGDSDGTQPSRTQPMFDPTDPTALGIPFCFQLSICIFAAALDAALRPELRRRAVGWPAATDSKLLPPCRVVATGQDLPSSTVDAAYVVLGVIPVMTCASHADPVAGAISL